MFRSSPPEVFSNKDTVKIRSKSTGEQTATLLKSYSRTNAPPRIHIIPAKHLYPGEHLWETAPVCQNSFKRLKL